MMDDHPDAEEIGRILDEAERKLDTIFEVVFAVSQYDAEVLIKCWSRAMHGDHVAVAMLMAEIEKLVDILTEEIIQAEEDGYEGT